MEHITITQIAENLWYLVPDSGYKLKSKVSNRLYSEAETNKPQEFEAVAAE